MGMWKKVTQTLGNIWAPCLMGALFGTTLVLFIKLPISSTVDSTLEESISGLIERLRERNEKSNKSLTGSGIMDRVQN